MIHSFLAEARNRVRARGFFRLLRDAGGAIDLASIMVGVLVIGIIGGVISATVFAVIPWSQDQAAKTALGSVRTSEGVAKVKESAYLDYENLVGLKYIEESSEVRVGTDAPGSCYVGVSRSSTGKVFYATDKSPDVRPYTTTVNTDSCTSITDLVNSLPPDANAAPGAEPALPVPTTGLSINTVSQSGSYSNNGNYLGRNLRLSFNGTWDMNQIPYITEPASVTQYAGQRYPYTEGITDLHAWIGGVETPISLDAVDSYIAWDPNGEYYFEFETKDLIIGDNMNATIREFLNTGAISFRIEGSTSVNNLIMDTSLNIGTTSNPPSGDGTFAAGDTLVQAPVMEDVTAYYHYLWTSSVYFSAQGTPNPTFSFTDTAPAGVSIFNDYGYGGVSGLGGSQAPLSFDVTATNSAGSDTARVNIAPLGATRIAGDPLNTNTDGADGSRTTSLLRANTKSVVGADGTVYVLDIGGSGTGSALKMIDPVTHELSTILPVVPSNSWAIALNGTTIYIATKTSVFRTTTSGGALQLVAGGDLITTEPSEYVNGTGSAARFQDISDMEFSTSAGVLYVADQFSVRQVTLDGEVTTVAGSDTATHFGGRLGISVAPDGVIYVADGNANLIRKITAAGAVIRVAGYGEAGPYDGSGVFAWFSMPVDVAYTLKNGVPSLLVIDSGSNKLRKITDLDGARNVSTINYSGGYYAETQALYNLIVQNPTSIVTGPNGAVYLGDSKMIRIIFGIN